MNILNNSHFSITVCQHSVLSGDIEEKTAQFILSDNNDITDILISDKEPFPEIEYSATRYELVVEYDNELLYDIWTIPLTVIDRELSDFQIVLSNEFKELQQFVHKIILNEKLNHSLQHNTSQKSTHKKI